MEGDQLLSQLKTSGGKKINECYCSDVGNFRIEDSTGVLKINENENNKLVLIDDGFIYFCPNAALVGMHQTESYVSSARANDILEEARLSHYRPKLKVLD